MKAVSDLIAPFSGQVLGVNQTVIDSPVTANNDPYGSGWLVRLRFSEPSEVDHLLDADAYRALLAED